ncbi:MAG: pyrroloquinoline quinone-dependent dehydrogenase [Methylophilaceae bacterium]
MKKLLSLSVLFILTGLVACSSQRAEDVNTQDWPSYGNDYTSQRFSRATQINVDNVKNLTLAWQHNSGVVGSFQTTPIVQNGIMYFSLPFNHVVALDAVTGKELWRYEHDRREDWKMCCGPQNRGVAVSHGKVYIGTVDARLIALDASNGHKLWDIDVVEAAISREGQEALNQDDPNKARKVTGGTGIGIGMAPVVYKGKVFIGITGVGYGLHIDNPREDAPLGAVIGVAGRFGRPGFLAAFDVNDGKRIWQFDTIPSEGWEGDFTEVTEDGVKLQRDVAAEKAAMAKYPDSASLGGGSAWSTPAIDTENDILYFGTGNPSPQMNDVSRPGDNLYTVSLVALDINTGERKWHYQQVPHDLWGYDLASPPVLFDYSLDGKTIPAVGQASKTGWFYIHDRLTGKLLKKSDAFVPQKNMFAKATFEGEVVYPGILGGSNWSPVSMDHDKQLVFISGIHSPIKYTLHETPAKDGNPAIRYASSEPTDDPSWGLFSAVDFSTGKVVWQNKTEQPLVGGSLATAGGVVFVGEGNGQFNAYNSQTGEQLWQAKSEFGVNAPPISYTVDGVQYIAVASGGNWIMGFKQGDAMLVYKLEQ